MFKPDSANPADYMPAETASDRPLKDSLRYMAERGAELPELLSLEEIQQVSAALLALMPSSKG